MEKGELQIGKDKVKQSSGFMGSLGFFFGQNKVLFTRSDLIYSNMQLLSALD